MGCSQATLMPGRLVNRRDLQCFAEVAEFWMYLLFSKGLFHRLGNPQAENSLSPALTCSFQGLLDSFIPEEYGCHGSSQMENQGWIELSIQSTNCFEIQTKALCLNKELTRSRRRGICNCGCVHTRRSTERGVWLNYILARGCTLSFGWGLVNNSHSEILIHVVLCGE